MKYCFCFRSVGAVLDGANVNAIAEILLENSFMGMEVENEVGVGAGAEEFAMEEEALQEEHVNLDRVSSWPNLATGEQAPNDNLLPASSDDSGNFSSSSTPRGPQSQPVNIDFQASFRIRVSARQWQQEFDRQEPTEISLDESAVDLRNILFRPAPSPSQEPDLVPDVDNW